MLGIFDNVFTFLGIEWHLPILGSCRARGETPHRSRLLLHSPKHHLDDHDLCNGVVDEAKKEDNKGKKTEYAQLGMTTVVQV